MKQISILFALVVPFTFSAACGIQEPESSPEPTDISTNDDPSEDPVDDPIEDPVDDPVDDPSEDPVDDPIEDPVVVEEPVYLPAPFKLASSEVNGEDGWRFSFSTFYISDAPCGEARGDWDGMFSWGDGIALTQGEGGYLYFEINREFDVEVVMSYIQGTDCGDSADGWAQYGAVDQLSQMSPEALEWIYCGWGNGGDGSNSCNIRLHVTADAVTPMGNMHNHNFNL